ncbi:MAG: hypothetical protein R2734_14110 [Nocardioides sp.]
MIAGIRTSAPASPRRRAGDAGDGGMHVELDLVPLRDRRWRRRS